MSPTHPVRPTLPAPHASRSPPSTGPRGPGAAEDSAESCAVGLPIIQGTGKGDMETARDCDGSSVRTSWPSSESWIPAERERGDSWGVRARRGGRAGIGERRGQPCEFFSASRR